MDKAYGDNFYLLACKHARAIRFEKDKFRVKVEISLFHNWVGGYQERCYKIEITRQISIIKFLREYKKSKEKTLHWGAVFGVKSKTAVMSQK